MFTKLQFFFLTLAFISLSFDAEAYFEGKNLKIGYSYLVTIETTKGDIVVQLLNSTPKHRDNFVSLCREGYYDGIAFHRIINDFMIQGGDIDAATRYNKTHSLYPDINEQTIDSEASSENLHFRGALAAAREGDDVNPEHKSCRSQFYIVQLSANDLFNSRIDKYVETGRVKEKDAEEYRRRGGTPHLDGAYTVFGYTLEGMSVVDSIAAVECHEEDDSPKVRSAVVIERTKVRVLKDSKINKKYKNGKQN